MAARRNDVNTLSTLLGDDPELIEEEAFKRSPLFYASEAGSVDAVRLVHSSSSIRPGESYLLAYTSVWNQLMSSDASSSDAI